MKILFCNIAWMKWYKGYRNNDMPVNGGSFVQENEQGEENDNFWPLLNSNTAIEWGDGTVENIVPEGNICPGFIVTGKQIGRAHV